MYFCFSTFGHAVPSARNSLFPHSFFKSLGHARKSLGQFVHLLPGLRSTSALALFLLDLDETESSVTVLQDIRMGPYGQRLQRFPCGYLLCNRYWVTVSGKKVQMESAVHTLDCLTFLCTTGFSGFSIQQPVPSRQNLPLPLPHLTLDYRAQIPDRLCPGDSPNQWLTVLVRAECSSAFALKEQL